MIKASELKANSIYYDYIRDEIFLMGDWVYDPIQEISYIVVNTPEHPGYPRGIYKKYVVYFDLEYIGKFS